MISENYIELFCIQRSFRVVRIILGRVSIFKLNYYGYSFDLNLVVIPQTALERNLPPIGVEMSLEQIDAITEKFVKILDPIKFKTSSEEPQVQVGMVYALSGRNFCDFEIKYIV